MPPSTKTPRIETDEKIKSNNPEIRSKNRVIVIVSCDLEVAASIMLGRHGLPFWAQPTQTE